MIHGSALNDQHDLFLATLGLVYDSKHSISMGGWAKMYTF